MPEPPQIRGTGAACEVLLGRAAGIDHRRAIGVNDGKTQAPRLAESPHEREHPSEHVVVERGLYTTSRDPTRRVIPAGRIIRLLEQAPESLIEWVFVAAGAATFMVFAVALQNFFVQPPILTRSQRLFQDLSVVVGVTHVVALLGVQTVSHTWAGIGIGMYAVALTLFLGAIEAARRSPITRTFVYEPRCDCILTAGPYRLIRHPIYLSYSLAWLAAPVAMQSAVLLVTAIFMITCYVISAREEERRLSIGPLAAEYQKHRASSWRLIPFVY